MDNKVQEKYVEIVEKYRNLAETEFRWDDNTRDGFSELFDNIFNEEEQKGLVIDFTNIAKMFDDVFGKVE